MGDRKGRETYIIGITTTALDTKLVNMNRKVFVSCDKTVFYETYRS